MSMDIKKFNSKKASNIFFEVFMCTVVPFLLPCIFSIPNDIKWLNVESKWTIFLILTLFEVVFLVKYHIGHYVAKGSEVAMDAARKAYSGVHELSVKKREEIAERIYRNEGDSNFALYDIHTYIVQICREFEEVVSSITHISKEYLNTTFIYRYVYKKSNHDEQSWRYIGGKESLTSEHIKSYIDDHNTTFGAILYKGNDKIYSNDKATLAHELLYKLSARDADNGNSGSIFSARIIFCNHNESFVESIITVSSYGKRFYDKNTNPDLDEKEVRNIIVDEIFPCYQKMIENELAMLYLQHIRHC